MRFRDRFTRKTRTPSTRNQRIGFAFFWLIVLCYAYSIATEANWNPSMQALAIKLSTVYVAIVAGLVLVTVLPIQASPIAICGLGACFIRFRSQQPVLSRPELC
jgi:TRAP-type C4-dicarboxylate transport system permease small subunit